MFLLILKKYWISILGGALIIGMLIYIGFLRLEVKAEKAEKEQYKYALSFQNEAIIKNKSDYDEAIKKFPTVLETIDVRYKTQTQIIYAWKDNNETSDCNDSLNYLNTYQF